MVTKTCPDCNKDFGLDHLEDQILRLSGDVWACPYCGTRRAYKEGVLDSNRRLAAHAVEVSIPDLRERLIEKSNRIVDLEASNRTLRGWVTRLKNTLKHPVHKFCESEAPAPAGMVKMNFDESKTPQTSIADAVQSEIASCSMKRALT